MSLKKNLGLSGVYHVETSKPVTRVVLNVFEDRTLAKE